MKTKLFLLSVLSLVLTTSLSGQGQSQLLALYREGDNVIRVFKKDGSKLTPQEVTILENPKEYGLFKVSGASAGVVKADYQSPFLSDVTPILDKPGPTGAQFSYDCDVPDPTRTDCRAVLVRLQQRQILDASSTYLLVVPTELNSVPLSIRIEPIPKPKEIEAKIVAAIDESRGKVRIQTENPLDQVKAVKGIALNRKVLELTPSGDGFNAVVKPLNAKILGVKEINGEKKITEVDEFTADTITLDLDKKLSEGQTHELSVRSGLVNPQTNAPISAKGTLKTAGIPKKADDLKFEFRISQEAAKGVKPFFDLYLKSTPRSFNLARNFFWEPEFTIDLGLGNTKSSNSIIVYLPFRSKIPLAEKSAISNVKLPSYYSWRKIPWISGVGELQFYYGPKFEIDRQWGRVNALGTFRFDLRFERWRGSLGQQREYLLADVGTEFQDKLLKEDEAKAIRLKTGFSLTPYFGIEFGGKLTNEVVKSKNKAIRTVLPKDDIFRAFAGFKNTIEWEIYSLPMSLSIEEKVFYVATEEVIGVSLDKEVNLRRLKGFHHRGVATLNFFLNQARRYSFTLKYENGRKEPNFEYLNKFSSGFSFMF